jgi:hypothetical protein
MRFPDLAEHIFKTSGLIEKLVEELDFGAEMDPKHTYTTLGFMRELHLGNYKIPFNFADVLNRLLQSSNAQVKYKASQLLSEIYDVSDDECTLEIEKHSFI